MAGAFGVYRVFEQRRAEARSRQETEVRVIEITNDLAFPGPAVKIGLTAEEVEAGDYLLGYFFVRSVHRGVHSGQEATTFQLAPAQLVVEQQGEAEDIGRLTLVNDSHVWVYRAFDDHDVDKMVEFRRLEELYRLHLNVPVGYDVVRARQVDVGDTVVFTHDEMDRTSYRVADVELRLPGSGQQDVQALIHSVDGYAVELGSEVFVFRKR